MFELNSKTLENSAGFSAKGYQTVDPIRNGKIWLSSHGSIEIIINKRNVKWFRHLCLKLKQKEMSVTWQVLALTKKLNFLIRQVVNNVMFDFLVSVWLKSRETPKYTLNTENDSSSVVSSSRKSYHLRMDTQVIKVLFTC